MVHPQLQQEGCEQNSAVDLISIVRDARQKWTRRFDVNNSFTEKWENCTTWVPLSVLELGCFPPSPWRRSWRQIASPLSAEPLSGSIYFGQWQGVTRRYHCAIMNESNTYVADNPPFAAQAQMALDNVTSLDSATPI